MTTTHTLPARNAVPVEQTWNRDALFPSWDAWHGALGSVGDSIKEMTAYEGRLGEGPDTLVEFFQKTDARQQAIVRLYVYISMSTAVDTSDTTAKSAQGQLMGQIGRMAAAMAFVTPELQAIGEKLLGWTDSDARLEPYRHYIQHLINMKAHTRSTEVEAVLGMLNDPMGSISNIYTELVNTDLKYQDAVDSQGHTHTVAQATITPTGVQSPDREHRRTAWQHFFDGHLQFKNTLAANFSTHLKASVFNSRVRGYSSVLESKLKPTGLPLDVFHNLVNTFQQNLGTWHKYWEVKRKVLGVEQIQPYDVWAPIVAEQPLVSYQESIDWLSAALAPLGDRYVTPMRKGCLEERWVDYAQNAGKTQGAFSTPANDSPPFIFMTYDNTLMAMSVLAHELGHSMHSYLAQRQPGVYRGYGMMSSTVAETASNFNQAMLRAYLLEAKKDDINFQIALIDEAMFNFHRYFFQMPTLARWEYEVYTRGETGKPLNADILNGILRDLYAEGYGSTMTDDPDRTAITWGTFPHMYMPYYTFQYSVGISAAHALADRVLNHGGADDYIAFLSAGSSMYPLDLFKLGGIDMSTPEPVEKTFEVLAKLVDRLEKLAA